MELAVGAILEGQVKSITNFGAFIQLPERRVGMVHISEISSGYVSDIHKHLTQGQTVRVKVLGIDEGGKISLSIKRAQDEHPRTQSERSAAQGERPHTSRRAPSAPKEPLTFEEKLKQFMSDSDSKISSCRQYEHKTKSRRR